MGAIGFNADNALTVNGEQPNWGMKNYLINGNFDVWQRGTSQTSDGYGSDDRWANYSTGSTKTHSQVACTDTERALFNASYFSRTVVSSVAGASYYVTKQQAIENINRLSGKTVTISFWAKADSSKNIAIELTQNFGTGGTPSSSVNSIGSQLVALTSTWQRYSITVNIPSIVGKTLGTDGVHTSFTILRFWFDAGSGYAARTASLGQQSGTFDIAQVQLEEGSVATPFEQRPYGLELSLCQRYFRKVGRGFSGVTNGTANILISGTFSEMRIAPTMTLIYGSGANALIVAGASNATINSVVNVSATSTSAWIYGAGSFTGNLQHSCVNDMYLASAEL